MKFLTPLGIAWRTAAILLAGALIATAAPKPKATPASVANPYSAATLVVYNETDKDSVDLARFYAQKRGIPKEQMIALKCAKTEEISREEYDRTIAEPLRRAFTANFWWKLRDAENPLGPVESNKIRFVALIRGVPLKIAGTSNYPGDKATGPPPIGTVNEASVDSELSTLGFRQKVISGAMKNPYFRSYTRIQEAHPELLLVCRLDGPTPEIVRGMITDSLAAEESGLAGFAYLDARGTSDPGYVAGDTWIFSIANAARRHGIPVILDNGPALYPPSYPMTHPALYFGWYSEHLSGPFVRTDFRFTRGAVAVHIHSFSAATLRDPLRNWCGPLLAAGAAATLGNVYEPYLVFTPQLDIFYDRLHSGLTFAESAYMSQRAVSWMTTFVGDPLYRPYKGVAELNELPSTGEWADYRKDAQAWFSADRAAGDEALRADAKKDRSGMIMEGLGLLQLTVDDRDAALKSFAQAREYYGKSEDALRVAVHEILQFRAAGREADIQALATKMITLVPKSTAVDLLRALSEPPAPSAPPAESASASKPAQR